MIAATVMLAFFASGVLFFGLRGATTRQQVNRTLPALVTLAFLAFLTAFFAFGDYLDALLPNRLDPIESIAEYESRQPFERGTMILLVGQAGTFTPVRIASTFELDFPDGSLSLAALSYSDINWDEDANEARFLDAAADVVVQVRVFDSEQIVVHTVFQGTHAQFLDYMPRFTTLPLITALLSVLVGVVCVVFPVMKRRQVT